MAYRHATVRDDYEDLASGAVLHSAPGFPAFPVRLATEMFQRAAELRRADRPLVVWDPCCGSGYLLTVVAILLRARIGAVLASDFDDDALTIAGRNLGLLTGAGLAGRAGELRDLAERFGKPSHAAAAEAAGRIGRGLAAAGGDVPHAIRRADVFDRGQLGAALGSWRPDVVLADVPYGEQTRWRGRHEGEGALGMVRALASVLPEESVIAVAARSRKISLGVRPDVSFRIGTRAVALVGAGRLRD
ncbi:rRNA methyltransferase [Streptosporangium sp. KLBMP 9127]|nr:rRNA methyltransferase [Streptosporangium sp. KLBMP 9127]